jgi:ankyrin repeat protein
MSTVHFTLIGAAAAPVPRIMLATATRPDITVSPPAAAVVNVWEAVAKNDVDGVSAYVKSGKTVHLRDPTGMTPLHYAAQQGHAKVVEVLIAAGADADARTTGTNLTPLWLAAYRGKLDAVKALARAPGCKVNPKGQPERAGVVPSALKGAVSAARAARQEHHDDVADFIEAAAAAAAAS